MKPILFSIQGVNFYSYGLFVALAFLICYLVVWFVSYKKKMIDKLLFEKLLLVLAAGIIFARILFYILYDIGSLPWYSIFNPTIGGMVSFGGLIGGFILFIILFRKNLWKWMDIFSLGFLAGAAIWRIGCFLSHDHPGIFTTAWYGINYEAPAILFEIIVSAVGFAIFMFIYKKIKLIPGILFFMVFGWYGLGRIFIDNFREDGIFLWHLKGGQFAGIIMLVIALIGILIIKKTLGEKHNERIK